MGQASPAKAISRFITLPWLALSLWLWSMGVLAQPSGLEPLSGAVQVAAGGSHTCALTMAGAVRCWGSNTSGQLGDGSTTRRLLPAADVAGLGSGVAAIAAGTAAAHSCALSSAGEVQCWGSNFFGQLGDGSTANRLTPVKLKGLKSGVSALALGLGHTCALVGAGSVKCWGFNSNGQLGDNSNSNRLMPVDVSGLASGVAEIAVGPLHTCARTTGGAVKCWGTNAAGQLGDGSTTDRRVPVDVSGLGSGVIAIAAGGNHTCALLETGAVRCWGANASGQLGDGSTAQRLTPTDVSGLDGGVAAIAAGANHTCARSSAGGFTCWGSNAFGQLGDGSTINRLIPNEVADPGGVAELVAGSDHTCVRTRAGAITCWGRNTFGQLGDGSTSFRPTPNLVSVLGRGLAAITAGGRHTCARTGAGAAKCWGLNTSGQLGDGSVTPRSTPVDVSGLDSGVVAIAGGFAHTCALSSAGAVRCWGDNLGGQLGDGSSASRQLTPVAVSGLASGLVAITAGTAHTCALSHAGAVKCWGDNALGQVGDGSTSARPTPVDVSGLSSGVTAIAAGDAHTCALLGTGAIRCWGSNTVGELGDGTTTRRLTPVDVSGLSSGMTALAAGADHSCALSATGAVRCWGGNAAGQLGDGSSTGRLTPVDVSGLSSGVSAIAAGGFHTCALTGDGAVRCWGANANGQVGDGSTLVRLTQVAASGLGQGVAAITAGAVHSCALGSTGAALCWGDHESGQLGVGGRNYGLPARVMTDPAQARIEPAAANANAASSAPVTDALGRYLVFESAASNLVPADGNQAIDVFRRDGSDGSLMRISLADDGSEIAGDSIEPSLSANGQWVVFVAPDSAVGALRGESGHLRKQRSKGSTYGVFLRNLATESTQRVGTALPGGRGTHPVIAPGGDAIAFTGLPTPPAEGTPGISTIFIVPLQLMGGELLPGLPDCPLCALPGSALSQSPSRNPALSADGRWLAFESEASQVAGPTTACPQASTQILLLDRHTGGIVSASSPSAPGQCRSGSARNPSIDWSGGAVVFETDLPLDVEDRNGLSDIYRFDVATGEHARVSVDPATGHDGLDASTRARLSGDGKAVAFQSLARNLESSAPDNNETNDIFVRDIETGSMRRVSRNRRGDQGNAQSDGAALSWDGGAVAFASLADNLLLDPLTAGFSDDNDASDVFKIVNPLMPIRKTATWWVPSESGWGLSTIDQGNALGVSWFTYDGEGEPTWFSGSALLQPDGSYVGSVFRHTGVPLAEIAGVATETSTRFADITLDFTGNGALSFDYAVVGGPSQRKQMSRFIFAGEDIVCRISPFPARGDIDNLSDVWWGGAATSGWGILLSQTTSIMTATWFTFDQDREAVFLIAITTRQPDGSYAGSIFRQRNGTPFHSIDNAPPSSGSDAIGTARIDIIDGETADFVYTLGATNQTRRISRFVFGPSPNACSTTRP